MNPQKQKLQIWPGIIPLLCFAFGFCVTAHAQFTPLLSINSPAVAEGDSGFTNLTFTVSLSDPSGDTVTVEYFTVPVSATSGVDYLSVTGLVTLLPGETSAPVDVQIIGDALNEPDETLYVYLRNATNALILDDRGDGTIVNDDPLPSLSISNVSLPEGDTGTTNAVFAVTLSALSGQTVSADFFTTGITATSGQDFVGASSTITFSPGNTNTSISIPVIGDLLNEDDETFSVTLTNVANATLVTNRALATIIDDDPLPGIAIQDVTVIEGTGGTNFAAFPVSLLPASGRMVSVTFATTSGTATSGADFTGTNGTLSFLAGVTNLNLLIPITTDSSIEPTENFVVNLSSPTNAVLNASQATATILDDETRTLNFTNAAPVIIPLQGAALVYPSSIELSGLVGSVVKVTATLAGASHSYPDDLDVLLVGPAGQNVLLMSQCGENLAINNVTLTFDDTAAGSLPNTTQISSGSYKPTSYSLSPPIFSPPAPSAPFGNALSTFNGRDPNGTWSLFVFDHSNNDGGSLARGWQLGLTLSNLVCCTGGNADLSVTVSDSPDPSVTTSNVTFTARIINNGPAGATSVTLTNLLPAGMNLVSASTSQGTLATNAGVITGNLGTIGLGAVATVSITAMPTNFGMFTNFLTVSSDKTDPNLTNNTALTPTTVNQLAPLMQVANAAVAEGDGGTTNLIFSVTLSRSNNVAVTLDYATTNGTATADSDYVAAAGTLIIPAGITNGIISVAINGDIVVEPNETFSLLLSNPTNGLLAASSATGTIVNDDGVPNQLYQFSLSTVSSPQYAGNGFPVTISARDISNNIATTFTGPARLSGLVGSGPEVSVVITEIDTGDSDRVEFSNVAGYAVDVSGWRVSVYDWVSWPDPQFIFTIPAGTTCGANEVFLLTDNGTGPGVYPSFFSGAGLNANWSNDETNNMVAVLLQDADGRIVDFTCAFDATPTNISNPVTIPSSEWTTAPIPANLDSTMTFRRTGNSDSNGNGDWNVGMPSLGVLNSGLTIPFSGTRPVPVSPALASNFVSGVWTGNLVITPTVSNLTLRARDSVGHVGLSNPFNVQSSANLTLTGTVTPAATPVNQSVNFSLSVSNGGLSSASAVFLTNTLPASANFISASASQGSNSRSGNVVTFSLGTLAAGATATASVSASLTTGGTFTNLAQASANLPDPVITNNSIALVVRANSAPVFTPMNPQTIPEGSTLMVTNVATDPDSPPNNLTYSLIVAPTGVTFTTNGVFTWATTESSGPSTNTVTVRATDDGIPSLSATQSFSVIVTEINSAPQFNSVTNQTIDEGTTLSLLLSAADSDLPTNTLTFNLISGPPSATISAGGLVTWATTEADGPGTNNFVVRVQDNGAPSLSATQSFLVIVREVNSAPLLASVSNQTATVGITLYVTNSASDSDLPVNLLSFTLLAGPTNSSLSTGGLFTWQPVFSQAGTTNLISVRVTDDGTPPLSATQSFLVTVQAPAAPIVIDGLRAIRGFSSVSFSSEAGFAYGIQSRLQSTTDEWKTTFAFTNPPVNTTVLVTDFIPSQGQHFFRVRNLTLPYQSPKLTGVSATGAIFKFNFIGEAGRTYALEARTNLAAGNWLTLTNYVFPSATSNVTYTAQSAVFGSSVEFRVVRFSLPVPAQKIDAVTRSGTIIRVQFTALPGLVYQVEKSDSLSPASWSTLANLPAPAAITNVVVTDSISGARRFYRLNIPVPVAEVSLTQTSVVDRVDLNFTANAGIPYTLQARTSLQTGNWQDILSLPAQLTNTAMVISDTNVAPAQKFYRLKTP